MVRQFLGGFIFILCKISLIFGEGKDLRIFSREKLVERSINFGGISKLYGVLLELLMMLVPLVVVIAIFSFYDAFTVIVIVLKLNYLRTTYFLRNRVDFCYLALFYT